MNNLYTRNKMCENCDCLTNLPNDELYFIDKTGDPQCVICMESIGEKNKTILKCGHTFHTSCFAENILSANNTCPLCRENVCKEANILPNLSKTMTAAFMEDIINGERGSQSIINHVEKSIKSLRDTNNIEKQQKVKLCYITVELLLKFGFNLGNSIQSWIQDGNSRYVEENDALTVRMDIDGLADRVDIDDSDSEEDEDEEEEDEEISIEPLFNNIEQDELNEEREQEEEIIQFLYDYNIERFLPRILGNENLRVFANLLNIGIDDLIQTTTGMITQPLFTQQEAEELYNCITDYLIADTPPFN